MKTKYTHTTDVNFARACSAQRRYQPAVAPTYPLRSAPDAWCDGIVKTPAGSYASPHWLCRAAQRTARHWLRTRGDAQARSLARCTIRARVTADHRLSVHVHAYSRAAQARARGQAEGIAARLEKTLRASAAGPLLGIWEVVVSWGYDPDYLGEEDRRRAEHRVAA